MEIFNLKPCPLCGGPAEVEELRQGEGKLCAVIVCKSCGLTLDWVTEYRVGIATNGARTVVRTGLDPFEAWNRRAGETDNEGGKNANTLYARTMRRLARMGAKTHDEQIGCLAEEVEHYRAQIVGMLDHIARRPSPADRCVCCGEIIPEGCMVCPNCENGAQSRERSAK